MIEYDMENIDEIEEEWDEDTEDSSEHGAEQASFVCEDCDYRWEETTYSEMDNETTICPMCGSTNVTQL